jgi:predicted MFS family arabinose efflux permease
MSNLMTDGTKPAFGRDTTPAHSSRYETGLVVLLFLTWGTVFLDRMSVNYLAAFPAFLRQFDLNETRIGLLSSVLALSWAASSLVFGAISDRVGRRPILIPAVFIFSALSWLSGITQRLSQLLLVRMLMGAAEGPTWSTITATIEESSSSRHRGRNVGIVVSAAALVGHAVAPVLTTQIGARFGWRAAFFAAGAPGIILGVLLWRYLREPRKYLGARQAQPGGHGSHPISLSAYLSVLRHRNMWFCCLASAGFMTWLWVMHAFAPPYITGILKRSGTFAGWVVGAGGLGEFLWGWTFPWLSDRWGRKPVLMYVALVSAFVPLTYQMPFLISHPWLMAAAGFVANGGQGMAALVLVLIPTESVSPLLAGTAIGLTTLVGEVFGGTLAPTISGAIADRFGLATPLCIAAAGAIAVFAAAIFIKETAPGKRSI